MSVPKKPRITFRRLVAGTCWQITFPFERRATCSKNAAVVRHHERMRLCHNVGLRKYMGRGFIRDEAKDVEADFMRFEQLGSGSI